MKKIVIGNFKIIQNVYIKFLRQNMRYLYSFLCLFFLIYSFFIESKIRLLTFHYNLPQCIEMQHKTLQKFLKEKDDYELIVFNDSSDEKIKKEIIDICSKLNILCVNFPQHLHEEWPLSRRISKNSPYNTLKSTDGSVRHCHVARYAMEHFGSNHDDIVGVLDGDMFIVKPFSIREKMKDYDIVASRQTDYFQRGYEYAWIALCFFKPFNLPNKHDFHFDFVVHNYCKDPILGDGNWFIHLDSGAQTYFYMKDNPSVNYKLLEKTQIHDLILKDPKDLKELGFDPLEISFLKSIKDTRGDQFVSTEFHFNRSFFHIGRSRTMSFDQAIVYDQFFETLLHA